MIYYLTLSLSLLFGSVVVALYYYYQTTYKKFQAILAAEKFKDLPEVQNPISLKVESGKIPEWFSGIMYRVGPGRFNLQQENGPSFSIRHAFDGLPFMHRFHINGSNQTVTYNSRVLFKAAQTSFEGNNKKDISPIFFGHLSQISFLEWFVHLVNRMRVLILFPTPKSNMAPDSASVGVTVTPGFPLPKALHGAEDKEKVLVSKTDANILQKIHAETLEPQRLFDYADYDARFDGQFSAAHHQYDPITKEVFNFSLTITPQPKLIVFKISPDGKTTTILSTITHHYDKKTPFGAAYIHSFWLTKNYVIIPEAPLAIKDKGLNMLLTGSFLSSMSWDIHRPTYCHVIRRHPINGEDGLIASIPIKDNFFTFHTGNAYEITCPSTGDSLLTLKSASFANGDIMHQLHSYGVPHHKRPSWDDAPVSDQSSHSRFLNGLNHPPRRQTCFGDFVQYQLNLTKNAVRQIDVLAKNVEFPRFNQQKSMLEERYVYGCQLYGYTEKKDETCCLVKIDTTTSKPSYSSDNVLTYIKEGYMCSEPIFVPQPSATEEDDGVLLSLMNHADCCYLIILDAKTMKEAARVKIGQFTAITFHGSYVDHEFEPVNIS
ncbi:carotenoid oxygenase [Mycotypha africana]|uniref:carotenoid oxygenase n=1 Tax=Mycotypha africana TaxID=64632 RepID=UPI0022FFE68C|nr:carotenoid oxygenase [Mycotypha africana]KAI8967397.1 carotenoid oxygenase [Mycotypha africana]